MSTILLPSQSETCVFSPAPFLRGSGRFPFDASRLFGLWLNRNRVFRLRQSLEKHKRARDEADGYSSQTWISGGTSFAAATQDSPRAALMPPLSRAWCKAEQDSGIMARETVDSAIHTSPLSPAKRDQPRIQPAKISAFSRALWPVGEPTPLLTRGLPLESREPR